MNLFKRATLVGGVALMMASVCLPAFAQGPGGRMRGGMITAARIPVGVLAPALKLTADQQTKIQGIETKLQDDTKALRPTPGAQVDQQTRRDNFMKMRQLTQTADAAITGMLSPDQTTALKGLVKDLAALNFVGITPEALPFLKLTDDQRAKLVTIGTAGQADMRAKMTAAGGDRSQFRQIFMQARQDARTKVDAVLTDDQKAALKAHAPRGFGGGRRGG